MILASIKNVIEKFQIKLQLTKAFKPLGNPKVKIVKLKGSSLVFRLVADNWGAESLMERAWIAFDRISKSCPYLLESYMLSIDCYTPEEYREQEKEGFGTGEFPCEGCPQCQERDE